jgi:hypothetical protein
MKLFLLRRKYDEHIHTFKLGPNFDRAMLCEVLLKALKQFAAKLFVRYLAPAKMNGPLHLVAFLKYPRRVVLLELVIVLVSAGAELYLLDGDESLFSFGLFLLLLLLVLEFAEVNYATDRRLSLRRNLYEIKSLAARDFERLLGSHNSYLRAVLVNDANFARSYALVYANRRPAISLISEASSSLKATDGLSS